MMKKEPQRLHHPGPSVAGTDEAGRGPLAGPVVAAAVLLPEHIDMPHLNDSKKLSERVREALFTQITEQAIDYQIAIVDEATIDRMNILHASMEAMRRAVCQLSPMPSQVLVDGNRLPPDLPCPAEALVKGDARSLPIAAASVLAKVTRDRLMVKLDAQHPGYGFAQHKGYPTAMHLEALRTLGVCPAHRQSFAPVARCLDLFVARQHT